MSDNRPLALVTGASAGLGEIFARNLANRGYDLVICARRLDKLEALSEEISGAHGCMVKPVAADLSTREGVKGLFAATDALKRPVSVLINNAGFGMVGTFLELDLEKQMNMIQLNIRGLVELAHGFAQRMVEHGDKSYILNVGSVAGHQPIPHFSVYAATKSFVRDFSEAIYIELSRTNVSVSVLEPGPTRTEFMEVAGMEMKGAGDVFMMGADEVVESGLRAMFKGQPRVVAGVSNKLSTSVVKFAPRRLIARVAGAVIGETAG